MAFQNSILAGTALARPAIHSPNYVPGSAGWTINADGSAEFLDLTIRGEFSTGAAGTPHIIISDSAAPPFSGVPRIALYSGDAQEINPAFVANFQNAGVSWFEIDTSDDGFGINQLIGIPPQSAANSGGWLFATTASGSDIGHVELDTDMQLRILNPNNTSLSSTNHGFQVGPSNSFNIAISDAQIQKRNNGAASALLLNESGGNVQVGDFSGSGTLVAANNNALALATTNNGFMIGANTGQNLVGDYQGIQARNNGVAAPMVIQNWGGVTVFGGDIVAPSMSPISATPDTTSRTSGSTSYAAGGSTATIATLYPTSGNVLIAMSGIVSSSGGPAQRALMSFEIRDTNSGGTLRRAATDLDANVSNSTVAIGGSTIAYVTGLPTSGTMFVRPMLRTTSGASTAAMNNVTLTIIPMP